MSKNSHLIDPQMLLPLVLILLNDPDQQIRAETFGLIRAATANNLSLPILPIFTNTDKPESIKKIKA
jgi:hypothetical protein